MLNYRYFSLSAHALYVLLMGFSLIFIPNFVLNIFGFEPTSEIWVKVLGLIIASFAVLFYHINNYGNEKIVRSSILSRFFVSTGLIFLALLGQVKINLILFAGIDALTAAWTWIEMKKIA